MKAWKTADNKMDNAAITMLSEKVRSSAQCCDKENFHVYAHRYEGRSRLSVFAWCSNCNSFTHFETPNIATEWKNLPDIDVSLLSAIPEYLERIKERVDTHMNSYLNEK